MSAAWARRLDRIAGEGRVRLLAGWLLLVAAVVPAAFREGPYVARELPPAMLVAGIVVIFLFLLRPRLGSLYEWRGAANALLVFTTATLGFSHVLGNMGDWPLARLYRWAQSGAAGLLSYALGDGAASLLVSPLYLFCAMLLLASFAYRSYKGFVIFIVLVLAYGLYPFHADLLAGYLLWLAGFCLLLEEPLYLPRRLRPRLWLQGGMRDLLLELRERPLSARNALFYLGALANHDPRQLPPEVVEHLRQLASTGLVCYDPATQQLSPSPVLRTSDAPPGVAGVVDVLCFAAQAVVLLLGLLYFVMPVDFLPEAVLGPLGYLDDLVLLLLSALPLAGGLRARFRRGSSPPLDRLSADQ